MTVSRKFATPAKSNPAKKSASPGKVKRVVTFSATHTSIIIPAERRASPRTATERALRSRRATPRKRRAASPASPDRAPLDRSLPASARRRPRETPQRPRLVDSGAVRVHVSRRTNPRRGADLRRSGRLVDQGATRVRVTRHTTPRRLHATRARLWSPPPSSARQGMPAPQAPRSEVLRRKPPPMPGANARTAPATASKATSVVLIPFAKKPRTNASAGGHRFRSAFSPLCSVPSATPVAACGERHGHRWAPERSLSRNLFD